MNEYRPVVVERRSGALALTPYATAVGILATIYLLVARSRQTEDGPLELYAALVALAVGITVFCGLWWAMTSRGMQEFAAWWRSDDPTAHVHLPIWGTTALVVLACLMFFSAMEQRIGVFGIICLICVLQVAVHLVVGRHLARRLEQGAIGEDEVSATVRWGLLVACAPLVLLVIPVLFLEVPILTSSLGGDIFVFIFMLAPLVLFLLYLGFAIVYGAGDAFEHTWQAVIGRGESAG